MIQQNTGKARATKKDVANDDTATEKGRSCIERRRSHGGEPRRIQMLGKSEKKKPSPHSIHSKQTGDKKKTKLKTLRK